MTNKKITVYSSLLLFFCFFNSAIVVSQSVNQPLFHDLDPEIFGVKGVATVLQSKKSANMWLTTTVGLGSYNGYHTTLFPHMDSIENSPLSNRIHELYEDKRGFLWFGYADRSALTCYNPSTGIFKHFKHDTLNKNSFPEAVVSKFLEDSYGRLWVSTWDGGILLFNKERTDFKLLRKQDQPDSKLWLKSDQVRDLFELEPNKILVTYFQEQPIGYPGIFDVEKNTVTPFPIEEYRGNLSENAFYEIKHILSICHFVYKDNYSKLWIGTYSGLVYIDLKNKIVHRVSGKPFNENLDLNLDNTINYIVDDQERLWTSTANSGILIVDLKTTKAFYHQQYNNCLSCVGDNAISNFTRDNDGNIWVTNGSRGVSVYSPYLQKFKLKEWKDLKMGFSNASHQVMPLNHMFVRNNKTIYLSSINGISVYDYVHDSLLNVIEPVKHDARTVNYLQNVTNFKFKNGLIYFTSNQNTEFNSNPSIYDPVNKTLQYMKKKEHGYGVMFNNDTSDKPTYVLSKLYNNLCYYNSKNSLDTFHIFENDRSPVPGYSQYLKNGKWFMSGGQYYFLIFDPITKKTIKYGCKGGCDVKLKDSLIQTFYYNNKDMVWMTTRNGIFSYNENDGGIKYWNKEIGIENMIVCGLVEDKAGNIWFSNSRELFHYEIKEKRLTRFNKRLNIQGLGFDHRGMIHTMVSDGDFIFFPSVKGLFYFDASAVHLPKTVPKLNVFNVLLNDSAISTQQLGSLLNGALTFSHNQNNLLFDVNTSQIYTPSPNRFKYKLIGLADKWVDNGTSNKINLQNLPPETYTLVVQCINGYNISSPESSFVFTISKPFWKTWWFILLSLICFGAVIIYVVKSREKALQKKQVELENIVMDRTQEVVAKANEINIQKELIEEKQKEIVDSIIYANRIQRALLASKTILTTHFKNYFVYFNPKDIVSGDFYWATAVNNKFYFIVADSTGHGVPGAFMSLLNISFLNEAINEKLIEKPGDILDHVRQRLIKSLAQDGSAEGGQDGMDCSLACFDFKTNIMQYACAYNTIIVVRKGELMELESDRMPVGKSPKENTSFATHEFKLQKEDAVYIITDGYADQFGGESGKKLKYRNLKNYILKISSTKIQDQQELFSKEFINWKGNFEQVDDVTVVGLRI